MKIIVDTDGIYSLGWKNVYDYRGILISEEETIKVLKKIKELFIDETYPERTLILNHLKNKRKVLPVSNLKSLKLINKGQIYLYHERLKKLYKTDFKEICDYIFQLEPWEDVDCIVFDESFQWLVGITHDDSIVICGV